MIARLRISLPTRTAGKHWWIATLRPREFFYSVASTGVFCRPTCGARLPRRENMAFHARPEEAGRPDSVPAAGVCPMDRRSHPSGPAWSPVPAGRSRCPRRRRRRTPLAREAALSTSHFSRVFKEVTGLTPKAYAQSVRSARVGEAWPPESRSRTRSTAQASTPSSRFYESSSRTLGMTPGNYRAGGAGETIRFASRGVLAGSRPGGGDGCGRVRRAPGRRSVLPGRGAERRIPRAEFVAGDGEFAGWVAACDRVEDPGSRVELPLDIRGTAFQHLVWRALQEIPPGTRPATRRSPADRASQGGPGGGGGVCGQLGWR